MELIRDTVDLSAYMTEAPMEHRVMPASDWVQDVIDHFHKPDTTPKTRLPWQKTHGDFHFRAGEVTLWGGINGHGKSMLHGQVQHALANQGERIAVASLEMPPRMTMARMARQAYGADQPPADYIKQYGEWTDGKLWLYDHVGSSNPKTMLAVIRYAVSKFNVSHFVVDNLMKVVHGEDSYNEQKDFVNGLCVIAKDTGCHIHLILHMKKGKTEADVPGKFDIKGTGAITDLVDNLFIVWRNKPKELAMRSGEDFDPNDPDALLILEKQRNGETEGRYRLYFDHGSFQYTEERNDPPKHHRISSGVNIEEVEF